MGVYRKQGAWWIDWYEGTRRLRKKTTAVTKTEAKRLLEKVKAKMLPRSLGLFDPKLKCSELVTRYLEALKGTRACTTWRRAYVSLRNFFSWCPVNQVGKLTPELCQRHAAHRKGEGASAVAINMEIGALKTCLNWAVENRLIPANPVARAKKLKGGSKGRLRFLSGDEIRRLLQAARGTAYHDIFYAFIRTGMRKGELIHLRSDDVDFELGFIRIGGHSDEHGDDDTKTHAERHVPMDSDLAEVIARQPRLPGCPFVFPTERGTVRVLRGLQAATTFFHTLLPPRLTGTMWSTVALWTLSALPQYWHSCLSRMSRFCLLSETLPLCLNGTILRRPMTAGILTWAAASSA